MKNKDQEEHFKKIFQAIGGLTALCTIAKSLLVTAEELCQNFFAYITDGLSDLKLEEMVFPSAHSTETTNVAEIISKQLVDSMKNALTDRSTATILALPSTVDQRVVNTIGENLPFVCHCFGTQQSREELFAVLEHRESQLKEGRHTHLYIHAPAYYEKGWVFYHIEYTP